MNTQQQFQQIPLLLLQESPRNVRKTGGTSINDLAASIHSAGLLQNLTVVKTDDGYQVVAGGRRLRALQLLAKEDRLPPALNDGGIPCLVIADGDAHEASLAENTIRAAMHPADQFEAYKAMLDEGKSETDVAERFGATVQFVRQRMKLAKVSPVVIKAFRDGKIGLAAVEAFSISNDHPAQERALKQIGTSNDDRWVRRLLTKGEVECTDRRVVFVGIEAYETAGGAVRRDMFDPDDSGYVADIKLLDRLVDEKMKLAADKLRAEGWAWIDYGPELELYNFSPVPKPDKSKTGAVMKLDYHGKLEYRRGVLKPGQRAPSSKGQSSSPAKDKKPGDLSFAQVQQLQAFRTAVLKTEVAQKPRVALAALAATLAQDLDLSGDEADQVVRIRASGQYEDRLGVHLRDTIGKAPASITLKGLKEAWKKRVPNKTTLTAWLLSQPEAVTTELLALCAGAAIQTVQNFQRPSDPGSVFAALAGVDLGAFWKVDVTWLAAQPKGYILAAVAEVRGKPAAVEVEKLGAKAAVVKRAADMLAEAGWLPKPLRGPGYAVKANKPGASEVQRCRECGCTETQACEGGCSWAEQDLCSACVKPRTRVKAKAPTKRAAAKKPVRKPAAKPTKKPTAKKAIANKKGKR